LVAAGLMLLLGVAELLDPAIRRLVIGVRFGGSAMTLLGFAVRSNVSTLLDTRHIGPPIGADPSAKGCAAYGGAGDDMSMPPYGPGSGTPHSGAPALPDEMQDPGRSASRTAPLALGALIVCAAAFLLGWVPLLGAALGLIAIVLVVLAARRGVATKRTYAGAVAAALGVLASVAVTVALAGAVILPGSDPGPDPVAAGESEELEDGTDETATPVAEEEPTAANEQPVTTEAETS